MSYDPETRRDTPLASKLKERIRRDGPISVAEYMHACLSDPEYGYYVTAPAIGGEADFVTAPEISQIFGELIGLWCAVVWQQMGAPSRVNLVELGPGRGTLMCDALRASRMVAPFFASLDVHMVEINPALIGKQRTALETSGRPVHWHRDATSIPLGPTILVANEFLDTTPVSQRNGEAERRVTLDGANRLVLDPPHGAFDERQDHKGLLEALGSRAAAAPLAALFIDYGHVESAPGDTLQALRGHRHEHPLCSPGEADVTVHVDFQAFATTAATAGLAVDGPISQGEFLGRLGIVERASRLMSANPAKASGIEMGAARLVAPQGMGSRFKAIGLRSSNLPKLPGFE